MDLDYKKDMPMYLNVTSARLKINFSDSQILNFSDSQFYL